MKKYLIIAFTLIMFADNVLAQSTIAKLKYEDAEEAYEKNDFKTVHEKLDEAEKLLNGVNPRTFFLRIAAQVKQIETDANIEFNALEQARANVNTYLSKYEKLPNNEEKYKTVYRYAKVLANYPLTQAAYDAKKQQFENTKAEKELAARVLEDAAKVIAECRWRPGITESEFLVNTGISGSWTRYDNGSTVLVGKSIGAGLSVGSYYPEGPAAYRVEKSSGIVKEFSINIKKGKKVEAEYMQIFESSKAKDSDLGMYFQPDPKTTSYTVLVPVSADRPHKISYKMIMSLTNIKDFSILTLSFITI